MYFILCREISQFHIIVGSTKHVKTNTIVSYIMFNRVCVFKGDKYFNISFILSVFGLVA